MHLSLSCFEFSWSCDGGGYWRNRWWDSRCEWREDSRLLGLKKLPDLVFSFQISGESFTASARGSVGLLLCFGSTFWWDGMEKRHDVQWMKNFSLVLGDNTLQDSFWRSSHPKIWFCPLKHGGAILPNTDEWIEICPSGMSSASSVAVTWCTVHA